MEIKVLCIGDVVGRPGRTLLSWAIPLLRKARGYDLVVVDAENIAGGSGLTPQIFNKLIRYGVDAVTLGDHCYRRQEIIPLLDGDHRLVRPANMPPGAAGKGWNVLTLENGVKVGVGVLMGRLYMKPADCPFRAADEMVSRLRRETNVILVEMHAEATSEKVAMGWHLDGRVSAVFGTHTHVPTADAEVLPGGTAYITDLGMTGPYDSVLGRNKRKVIRSLISGMPNMYDIAEDDLRIGAMSVTIETTTGRATGVESIILRERQLKELEAQVGKVATDGDDDRDSD